MHGSISWHRHPRAVSTLGGPLPPPAENQQKPDPPNSYNQYTISSITNNMGKLIRMELIAGLPLKPWIPSLRQWRSRCWGRPWDPVHRHHGQVSIYFLWFKMQSASTLFGLHEWMVAVLTSSAMRSTPSLSCRKTCQCIMCNFFH
jgi:hypothetical protein